MGRARSAGDLDQSDQRTVAAAGAILLLLGDLLRHLVLGPARINQVCRLRLPQLRDVVNRTPRERKELNHDPRFRAIRLGVLEYLLESGKAKRVAAATDQLDQSQTIAKSDSVQIAEVSP